MLICKESERNLVLRASVCPQNEHTTETGRASLMLILNKSTTMFSHATSKLYMCLQRYAETYMLLKMLSHLTLKSFQT